ncbi:helix-turn-helix domain-containing protein [Spirochaeta africana]|uniref:HTH araC/xylS-type domain-containing protein n=1 Tax=Spirochaeta africana (strain ATCC 700263 / DSM 8902 / Z-7692) TaxID=889378 RepID=H9UIV7_SPIAZ|nr:helix-turn-helix domain-containing protein [Spirochaeta africana]AFG37450.1 hypothetical protein Spiaf_1384 [Spirochaeta africana DSM 8902]
MNPELNLSVISLIGACNALFFALVFWRSPVLRREDRPQSGWLALLFLAVSIGFLHTWYIESGLYRRYPQFILFGAGISFLTGPLLYLYACSVLDRPVAVLRRGILHFTPFFLHTLATVPMLLQPGEVRILYWDSGREWFYLWVGLQLLHTGVYMLVIARMLRTTDARLEAERSTLDHLRIGWLKSIAIAVVVMIVFYAMAMLGMLATGMQGRELHVNRLTDVVLFILVYIIAFQAMQQRIIGFPDQPETGANRVDPRSIRYQKSSLSEAEARQLAQHAEEHMQQTLAYLDPELSLRDLARELGTATHHLSQALNQIRTENFYCFVNRFRAQHAADLLLDPGSNNRSILEIAYESGFRSKSTFNAMFKQFHGTTPTRFRSLPA